MLNALLLPLLFSMAGGTFVFLQRPDQRHKGLLVMILFQLVGAGGYVMQPHVELFALLCVHAVLVVSLMTRHFQAPLPAQQPSRDR
ncbi:hypothetical protein LAJ19_04140 [Deinococcus taeanensis]|uniref:hypothetical protein n=1 Tax=Deinococcus taeanensis TaxID=2737050 RepID=UPI001CDD1AE4|nr:hypothetical protein [Deinococcus taeanensis]UBV43412.1 hypothetical protein LAJ19_04140 [Deinococcus taeanensis]